jgi:trk system potassium uptake protein TrkH
MNIRLLLYILGSLLIFLSISMLLPLIVAFIYREDDFFAILISAGITAILGMIFYFTCKIDQEIKIKEGFALVALTWLCYVLFGSLPFYLSHYIPSYTNAFFETMSGFTTTGASILNEDDLQNLPHGLLFWRSFTHWLGGMGIILLSLAIFPLLGIGGMQLYRAEVPGPEHDRITPRIRNTAKILWQVYLLISLAEVCILYIAGMNFFDALCHTFGTMATGGFSTKWNSIGFYNNTLIDYIIILFMLIAGLNFSLHYRMLKGNLTSHWFDPEARFFFSLIGLGTLIIGIDIFFFKGYTLSLAVKKGLFQVVSIITTTGYTTDDYQLWGYSSQIILLIFMFIGGCAGSTGGGIKIIRIMVILKFGLNEIKRLLHPNAVLPVRIGKRSIPQDIVTNICGFFLIYLFLFIIGIIFMSILGLDIVSSIGSVAATIGNIGPGLGGVGPSGNYANIPIIGKWFLSFLMLFGRLEIFTVIVLIMPIFWKK